MSNNNKGIYGSYFPVRNFAQPQSEDRYPLDDNSEQLQEEILKEAQKYTIEEYNKLKLRTLIATVVLVILYFALPNISIWFIVICVPILVIFLWFHKLRLTPKGEILLRKIILATSFSLVALSPLIFLWVYLLSKMPIVSAIIFVSVFSLGILICLLYNQKFKESYYKQKIVNIKFRKYTNRNRGIGARKNPATEITGFLSFTLVQCDKDCNN